MAQLEKQWSFGQDEKEHVSALDWESINSFRKFSQLKVPWKTWLLHKLSIHTTQHRQRRSNCRDSHHSQSLSKSLTRDWHHWGGSCQLYQRQTMTNQKMPPQKWHTHCSIQPWLFHRGALKLTSLGIGMLWNKAKHRCHSVDFPQALAALRHEQNHWFGYLGRAEIRGKDEAGDLKVSPIEERLMHAMMYVWWCDVMRCDAMWCDVVYCSVE